MQTFYHYLIGKQLNVEIVTQISKEPIITFQNDFSTLNEMDGEQ